jgi:hypothetical protein
MWPARKAGALRVVACLDNATAAQRSNNVLRAEVAHDGHTARRRVRGGGQQLSARIQTATNMYTHSHAFEVQSTSGRCQHDIYPNVRTLGRSLPGLQYVTQLDLSDSDSERRSDHRCQQPAPRLHLACAIIRLVDVVVQGHAHADKALSMRAQHCQYGVSDTTQSQHTGKSAVQQSNGSLASNGFQSIGHDGTSSAARGTSRTSLMLRACSWLGLQFSFAACIVHCD